jgi:excisionase family DNA binding protein
MLLTVKEVATLLRIHRPKVYDLIRDGTLEGFKLGSDWRVKRDSVERLVGEIPLDFFSKQSTLPNGALPSPAAEGFRKPAGNATEASSGTSES